MAGPLVFWPNRKSQIGLQRCSRTPRSLGRPFTTTPPIAEGDMTGLLVTKASVLDRISRAKTIDEKVIAALEFVEPALIPEFEQLRSLAMNARDQLATIREDMERSDAGWSEQRAEWDRVAAMAKEAVRENEALKVENAAKTADLRRLQKEIDPDEIKLRIMYAVDEALADKVKELAAVRATIADQTSRITELERSKKRLREALDRLARAT